MEIRWQVSAPYCRDAMSQIVSTGCDPSLSALLGFVLSLSPSGRWKGR